jgi:hypothetical protein
MSDSKMKAEFAAWYLASVVEMYGEGVRAQAGINLAWSRDDGSYADPMLRLGLMAWEASRAAVVVELPSPSECDDGFCWIEHSDAVKAIEVAGLKVKS